MRLRTVMAACAALLLAGCVDRLFGWFYDGTDTGELKGKLVVEWIDQDKFLFLPDAQDPLVFVRKNKEVIRPERMYTDGGSVPPALRAVKSYSPWGYAPAFIFHDWLFVMKQCKIPGFENYDLDKAATIMAEAMKTLMENPKYGGPNKLAHYSMYEGVRSSVARNYWDNGSCDTPTGPRSLAGPPSERRAGRMAAPAADGARLRVEFSF